MTFQWLPILEKLQGKKPIFAGGAFGYIDGIWVEAYDDKIFAFPDHQTRHVITMKDAKELFKSKVYQPSLF